LIAYPAQGLNGLKSGVFVPFSLKNTGHTPAGTPKSEILSADDIRCRGCLSDDRFMHCRQCEIKACTKEKCNPYSYMRPFISPDFIGFYHGPVGYQILNQGLIR
jgi:hypothetical protein